MIVRHSASSQNEQLLDQVIAEYLRQESAGNAGAYQQWLARYPACAAGLEEFFANREQLNRLVTPVRQDCRPPSSGDQSTGVFEYSMPSDVPVTVDLAPNPPRFANPRYRPLRFHARGGMGEVWLAHDELIGRNVALKKLRPGRRDQQARFLVEAQVTGQLEHPSVVPLHDMGTDDKGQMFYVMKFVQGRPLREAIADFHENKRRTDWAGEVEFVRLLQTFVGVCHAIAYAHSKGVMHRDIKPDNIMLGPFGETLILDWGLAKVLGQSERRDDPSVKVSPGDSSTTQDGAIVGTLTYISPEAARGNTEEVDQSSDVYLLGGTLYELMTGAPPRRGSSQYDLIDVARRRIPTSPRKLDSRIPRALEAICLKAMAFEKRDRYPTAIALAEDVQRYLAGEATIAYQEPLAARVARRCRRHRRGIIRGLMLAVFLALAAFALHSGQKAVMLAELDDARGRLEEFFRLADEVQFYAANIEPVSERVPYYDPRYALAAGESALAIARRWHQRAEDIPLPEARAPFRAAQYDLMLAMARAHLRGDADAASAHESLALLDMARAIQPSSRGYHQLRGQCLELLGQRAAAQQERELAGSDDLTTTAQDAFLQGELLRLQDAGSGDSSLLDEGRSPRAHLDKAIAEYRRALRLDPRHYWARFQLSRCLLALGRAPESIEALSACIALRPNGPWAYATRGLAHALSGEPGLSEADLNRAIELDPQFQPARLHRGIVYLLQDDLAAAKVEFDAVLSAAPASRLVEAALYRGQLLMRQQRMRDALADVSMVIAARPQFGLAYWQRARARFCLGDYDGGQADLVTFLSLDTRRSREAKADHRLVMGKLLRRMAIELTEQAKTQALVRARDQLRAAVADAPTAECHRELGAVEQSLGRLPDAIRSYSEGLALAANDVSLRNLRGWAYVAAGDQNLARADFAEAIRLEPNNPESHAGLGFVTARAGSADNARKEASAALLIGVDNYLVLHNVACIYGTLSQSEKEDKVEHENLALAVLKRALIIARKNGSGAAEEEYIRNETAFPDSLRARSEFRTLLETNAPDDL